MSEVANLYDSGPISPIARIKENLSVFTGANWAHYKIEFIEPIPPGPASVVDMVAVPTGVRTQIAANGTITKQVINFLQVAEEEFLHVRFEPLDNVEGVIWEQSGQPRFAARNIHARVDKKTRQWDPYLSTTTFYIIGLNRDMNLEVRNPMGYIMPVARFIFWGERYVLTEWPCDGISSADQKKLKQGDQETVRRIIGQTTWIPAEGRVG